jgi:uncharacterized protein (DUF885 family)
MKPVRRQLLRSLLVASAPLLGCTPSLAASSASTLPAGSNAQRVIAIADDYLANWRETFPEINTTNGIPGARHDRLTDNSAAAEKAWQAREDRWLAQLRTIDPSTLIGRPEWVTYGLLREELESSTAMRVCNFRVWNVSPMIGMIAGYAPLAVQQPVGTDDLRAQALTRWHSFPR